MNEPSTQPRDRHATPPTAAELAAWPVAESEGATAIEDEPKLGHASLGDPDDTSLLERDDEGGGNGLPPEDPPPTDYRFGGRGDRPKRPGWMRKLVILVVFVIGMFLSMAAGWHIGKLTNFAMGVVDRGMS